MPHSEVNRDGSGPLIVTPSGFKYPLCCIVGWNCNGSMVEAIH
jgi:hypothetical protein